MRHERPSVSAAENSEKVKKKITKTKSRRSKKLSSELIPKIDGWGASRSSAAG